MDLKAKRSFILVMLFLCGMINYLDRSALSISAPHIEKDFALNAGELGIIFSAFSIGYAAFNVIGGFAADKFGPKDTLLVALIIWSIFSGAVAFSIGFMSLLVIRVIFGMAEGPLSTTVNKTVDLWYPSSRKTSIVGLADSATPLGAAISGPLVGYITIYFNWRVSFICIMVIGLVWAFFWWRHVDNTPPKFEDDASSNSQDGVSAARVKEKLKVSFYFKQRTIIFTAIAYFAYNYILFFFLTWFPSYLIEARHMSLGMVSLINVIPWTLGFVAMAVGGFFSDYLVKVFKKQGSMFPKRLIIGCGLLFSGIAVFLVNYATNNVLIITLITLAVFFMYFTGGIYWGVVDESVDSYTVGSVGGAMHGFANCAGIIGPSITGFIVQFSGNFVVAFILAGILGIGAGLGALAFIKEIKVEQADIEKYGVAEKA